ncbi:MAG: GTPase-associated system all-helical protein GASH [Gammaproteobacteria bacterium]|nr:GTPase-associated system all-helical protein GASH [Gammaproteobacteria bacterium]
MSDMDRYLLLCDPQWEGATSTQHWKKAVQGISRVIVQTELSSPWQMSETVARIPAEGKLGANGFSTKVAEVAASALPDSSGPNDLFVCACVISAAVRVLENRRLSNESQLFGRDSFAVALWSALSFQKPLAEQRLEEIRAELLYKARRAGVEMAREKRIRKSLTDDASRDSENEVLRWNACLDREEIEVLRWTLADESELLGRPYADVGRDESVALARGLELGQLLTRFPVFGHYQLASRDVTPDRKFNLRELVEVVDGDCESLVAPFAGNAVIENCPATFPLLTALRGGSKCGADNAVKRTLVDWCGRALLESAIVRRSRWYREGS